MPVPSLITELTINAATNSPDGDTESVITTDNYFRAHAAFIAQLRDGKLDATLNSASTTLGAVKLDNPGGTTRSLTQWNGTAYTSFNANSLGGYQAPTYYFNLANCYVAADIGTGNPGFLYDAGDFMDYNRASNVWRVVIGGVAKVVSGFDAFFNYDTIVRHEVAGPSYHVVTNTTAPVDQKRWRADHNAGSKNFQLLNDTETVGTVYDAINRSGMAITTRRLNESGGRLLVGQGAPDDGVTALQTTSYSASNQPSLVEGGSLSNTTVAAGTRAELPLIIRTLKGGVTVAANNLNVTVPVAGLYLVTIIPAIVPASGALSFDISKNGAITVQLGATPLSAGSFSATCVINLAANDFISFGATATFSNLDVRLRHVSIVKLN